MSGVVSLSVVLRDEVSWSQVMVREVLLTCDKAFTSGHHSHVFLTWPQMGREGVACESLVS
jgi:hypothetical protein